MFFFCTLLENCQNLIYQENFTCVINNYCTCNLRLIVNFVMKNNLKIYFSCKVFLEYKINCFDYNFVN